jgi:aryl carrier-like protein
LAVCHNLHGIKSAVVDSFLDDFLAALEAFAAPLAEGGGPNGHERAIAEIIVTAIGLDALDVDANYLDAGVDSITSIRILAKIRRLFPAATMRDVIEMRTVRALAGRLHARGDASAIDATGPDAADLAGTDRLPEGVVDAYPATATQLQMIRATQSDPAQSAYHDVFAYTIGLPLEAPVLRTALRTMTDSCETLRTAFVLDATPVPLQRVYGSVEPDLTIVDASGQPAAADEWFDSQRGSGFVWDRPGLIRYAAHRTAEAGFVLSLSFHHSIIDGWSLSLFIRDLLTSYAAGLAGEEHHPPARPGLAYRDYVRAETAAQSSAVSRAYWRDVLAGHPGTTLPRYRPGPVGRRWTETTVVVPPQQEARLRSIAQHAGYPLKHLMLAAHLRTLALITDDSDVVTGVFTHGRPEAEGGDSMIGMFLNFQPHRSRLHAQTWPELIEEVFRFEARALPHRRYPASAIARDLGRAPLFPALFNYTEFPAYSEVAENGGHITGVRWFEHVDVPFLVNVGRDISQSRLEVTINADGRVLPQEVTDAIARLYTAVLAHITAQPCARVLDTTDEILATVEELRQKGTSSRDRTSY